MGAGLYLVSLEYSCSRDRGYGSVDKGLLFATDAGSLVGLVTAGV